MYVYIYIYVHTHIYIYIYMILYIYIHTHTGDLLSPSVSVPRHLGFCLSLTPTSFTSARASLPWMASAVTVGLWVLERGRHGIHETSTFFFQAKNWGLRGLLFQTGV